MANIPEISVAPEIVTSVGDFALSNAMISAYVVLLIMAIFMVVLKSKLALVPGRTQVAMEGLVTFFYNGLVDAYGSEKRAAKHLPLILGLFLFIMVANQFTIIPFVQSIVTEGGDFFFRNPTSHFALPITLSLIVFLVSHVIAFTTAPIKHIGNFIKLGMFLKVRSVSDFLNALLENFLAILDIIGEFAKVISLAARLFGNVFAGGVMVAVISGLSAYTQFVVPLPFWVLSIFSGFIQALVFAILAMAFISGMAKSVE